MADSDVSINISGDATGAQQAFKAAADAAKEAAGSMGEVFKGIGDVLDGVREHFAAITAVLAGGAIFREAIGEAKAFTGEVTQLSKQLGISAQEASGLNVALTSIGSDADSYTGALSKLTKQVRTNEAGLNEMGIATRDANGHFLDGRDLMDSAIKALLQYKEGTDRNLAAQVAFGKGAQESAALLKLSRDIQEEGAKTARNLNLIIGPENQAAVKTYKVGMIEVGEVMKAVENTIGQAVIPGLGELAKWFAQVGPPAIAVFKPIMSGVGDVLLIVVDAVKELWDIFASAFGGILKIVAFALTGDGSLSAFGDVCSFVFGAVKIALLALEQGFSVVFGAIGTIIEVASAYLRRFGTTAELALRGEWGQAKAAWAKGTAEIEKILDDSGKRMVDSAQRTQDKIVAILQPKKAVFHAADNYGDGPDKGKRYTGGDEKAKADGPTLMARYEAELATQKLAIDQKNVIDGTYYTMGKKAESDFWASKLATVDKASKEYPQILKKSIDAQLAASKENFEGQLADLNKQEEAAKFDYATKIALASQEVAMLRQHYAENSREVQAGLQKVEKLKQEAAAQEKQIAETIAQSRRDSALAGIDLEQQQAELAVSLGQKTDAQLIADLIVFENRRYAIQVQALNERMALAKKENNPVEQEKIRAQELQTESSYQAKLFQIKARAAQQDNVLQRSLTANLEAGFQKMVSGVLTGTLKMRDIMKQTWQSIADSLASAVTTMVKDWLVGELTKTTVTQTESALRVQKAAGEAAANAYNAIVGIPYVGPFLAPAAAAVAYAAVTAFAQDGYDVPAGVNPVTQLHAKEMVLPAKHADVIRSMSDNGGSTGGTGGGGHTYNVTVNGPQDKRSMERWMADLLPGATNISQRNFGLAK